MPESPDITVYVECLAAKVKGDVLQRLRLLNPFLLRTALPPIASVEGLRVLGVERLGERVVLVLEGELFLVLHLMIAGHQRQNLIIEDVAEKIGTAVRAVVDAEHGKALTGTTY